jgi:hypothetical protein
MSSEFNLVASPDNNGTVEPLERGPATYAYKPSLIGSAHQFELMDHGLSWRIAGRSGVWAYTEIASIRLSYRPVSMQSRRFRADIAHCGGGRITMLSTTWHTATLMARQDSGYRDFIVELHCRLKAAGSKTSLSGGIGRVAYFAAIVMLSLVGIAIAGLLLRALATKEFTGALFLVGFAALLAWQIGGFIRRNRPRSYGFDHVPDELLP